jgi:adenylyltransferase/sulfurtransferase
MPVKIVIPTPLRQYAGNQAAIEVSGTTVSEALQDLVRRHAGIRKHLLDDKGAVRSFVNVYVNEEDIRHLDHSKTPLSDKDVITIVPSVAGGTDIPWRS